MARPSKPTKIKESQGTLAKSRSLKNEMTPKKYDGIPDPPEELQKNKRYMQLWERYVSELSDLGMLHEVDFPGLAALCIQWVDYFEYMDEVHKEGAVIETPNGSTQVNPKLSNARNALALALKLTNSFGFTPESRTKISMPEKPQDEDDKFFK